MKLLAYLAARLFTSSADWQFIKAHVALRIDPLPAPPTRFVPKSREELRAYQRMQTL